MNNFDTILLPRINDVHVHWRQGQLAHKVAKYSARYCHNVIVMPNTNPPITSDLLSSFRQFYLSCLKKTAPDYLTNVHMTAILNRKTTVREVRDAKLHKAIGFKLYPDDVTTGSKGGITRDWLLNPPDEFIDILKAIRDQGLVLMMHGEMPDQDEHIEYCLDREEKFHHFVEILAATMPGLKFTLEHITTAKSVALIRNLQAAGHCVMGTITAHHLRRITNHILGSKLHPDEYCLPVPKRPQDRDALIEAATSGESCFCFGSDSAPHEPENKYCQHGCAGVFSAPFAAETVVDLFHKHNKLGALENFLVGNAEKFYALPRSNAELVFERSNHIINHEYDGIVTFMRGEKLGWRIREAG